LLGDAKLRAVPLVVLLLVKEHSLLELIRQDLVLLSLVRSWSLIQIVTAVFHILGNIVLISRFSWYFLLHGLNRRATIAAGRAFDARFLHQAMRRLVMGRLVATKLLQRHISQI